MLAQPYLPRISSTRSLGNPANNSNNPSNSSNNQNNTSNNQCNDPNNQCNTSFLNGRCNFDSFSPW